MDVRRGEGHLTTEAGQAVAILGAQRLVLSDLALSILESVPAQGTTSLSELATSVEAEFGAPEPPHTSQALTEAHVHDLAAHGLLVIDGGQAPGSSAGSSASAVAAVRNAVAAVMAGSPGWSLPTDVSAGSFVAAAERHRVVPQLSRQVALLDLPLAARAGLAARTAHLTRSNEDALRDLRDALQVLRAADIRVLVVKGVALAAQAWGDESARGYGDLDLLVPPAELGRTHALLAETGWRASRGFPVPGPTWAWRQHERSDNEVPLQRGETMIDLHWHLGPSRSLHPGFDELWTRRSSVLVSGTEVATLGLYDALAHSAGHTAKDHWEHLRGLADVWQLLRRPETWSTLR